MKKPERAPVTRATAKTTRPSRVGKPVQFWMHDEDRKIVRELSAWLAGQGVRVSDSLVIRTALRAVRTGSDLLRTCHEAAQLDGRLRVPAKAVRAPIKSSDREAAGGRR